jgi:hypothetical protein
VARRKLLVGVARAAIRLDTEGPLVPHKGRLSYFGGGDFVGPEDGFPIHPKNLERAQNIYRGGGEMPIPDEQTEPIGSVLHLRGEMEAINSACRQCRPNSV